MDKIRVSTFSAHRRPEHTLFPNEEEAMDFARDSREQQLAVVITNEEDDEPTDFGTGIDDRR